MPFIGPFHKQCVMMRAIYKRYKRSELGELLVAEWVIAKGNRVLKGKRYKRGLCCLRLVCEALMSQLVKGRLAPDKGENLQNLRDASLSQEPRVAAHAALDADLEILLTNIFTQTWDLWYGGLSGLPVHGGRADAECARSPRLQLGRVRQLSARHAAMDGSVRQQ